jgi:hypothetical protein
MSNIVTRAELSRILGVSKTTITRACKVRIASALVDDGIDIDHPLVQAWMDRLGIVYPEGKPKPKPEPEPKPGPEPKPEYSIPKPHPRMSFKGIEDFENLTVRQVVMKYGTVEGLRGYVDVLKTIADYKHRELRVKQQRGELIAREKVAGVVFPIIDSAFSQLVSDVPEALSSLIVARCEAGGSDTLGDIVQLIRKANGRVLKNLKEGAQRLEILKSEA